MTWPANNDDDAANAEGDDAAEEDAEGDDNFEYYHQFDSKLCSAADYYKSSCGWGCKRMANKGISSSSYSSSRKYWNGLEKFFLFFWSVTGAWQTHLFALIIAISSKFSYLVWHNKKNFSCRPHLGGTQTTSHDVP